MAKYLKLFETSADYQQFIGGGDFLRPNVSLVNDTKSLFYNPLAQEEPELPYLTITALEDDLTVSLSINPCQYSLNGIDWVNLPAKTASPAINTGEKIYFKAEGLTPSSRGGIGTFTISKRFNLSGTVMSMLFGDKAEGKTDLTGFDYCFSYIFNYCTGLVSVSKNFLPATTLAADCYHNMFFNCSSLINAPELPATTLANHCYNSMFFNCSSLINAPELPATELATACYGYMFDGCTSLVNAPELPATTLANHCYNSMFSNCSSLINAPELPVNELANYCYGAMFAGCTSLVNAPELPATTLAEGCYELIFSGCTSLVNAPELPTTTLANICYNQMFAGCTSLNYIKMLATDISATGCLKNWVYGVSSTGTFVKSKDAAWDVTGVNGIPEGWTVETA